MDAPPHSRQYALRRSCAAQKRDGKHRAQLFLRPQGTGGSVMAQMRMVFESMQERPYGCQVKIASFLHVVSAPPDRARLMLCFAIDVFSDAYDSHNGLAVAIFLPWFVLPGIHHTCLHVPSQLRRAIGWRKLAGGLHGRGRLLRDICPV